MAATDVRDLLAAAVAEIGGTDRAGQVAMAEAVAAAFGQRRHLLVQAGTGTGKSLAYLVPSLLHDRRVVVATATLALQHQLLERDIPALKRAARELLDDVPHHAVVKGRANYACLHRVRDGTPDDQGVLVEVPEASLGAEVVGLREWVEDAAAHERIADRESAPAHSERAWRQISVGHRECLGASRCPYGAECFAERAREDAQHARLVITNHALLAIDAIDGVPVLPEHDVVVIDEAHELAARVTQAATAELDPVMVERAARRCRALTDRREPDDLTEAADGLAASLALIADGPIDRPENALGAELRTVRDAARGCLSAITRPQDVAGDAPRQQAVAAAEEVRAVADRMARAAETDVLWRTEVRGGPALRVAPIDVASELREKVFAENTVVLTSATLALGGGFDPLARTLGLEPGGTDGPEEGDEASWTSEDVGSPFDYARQGICYVARHLPPPGRDGMSAAQAEEIVGLLEAAGGRTLGLFSSLRAAEAATAAVREALPDLRVWCQGEAQLSELARRFVADERACLFGTLSLWQGVDVPGSTCQLVLIDRIPFPRPDDPVMSARQRLVERQGGNGFMTVAATHAALLLAQGAGRLIRRSTDRGVVALLDSRVATARYGDFLLRSLPAMWRTSDPAVVRAALRRLDLAAADAR